MCADLTLQSSTCVCQFASVCFVCQASHIKICVLNFTKQWMCVFVCYMQCVRASCVKLHTPKYVCSISQSSACVCLCASMCFVCLASHIKICVLNFTKMIVCVLIVSSFRDQKNVCSTSQSSTCVYQCVLQMSSFTHETFCA